VDTLDPRLLRVGIEVGGAIKLYEDLSINVGGTKFANANQNEAEIKIANLDRATMDYLLTATSPFNRPRRRTRIQVEAGRVSTGHSLVFVGDITTAIGGQPPDVTISLKAATGDYDKGVIVARSQPALAPLRNIAQQVATDMGLSLVYEAAQKQIANWSFTGAASKQVDLLGQMGRVNAYVDDGALIVKDYNAPLRGRVKVLNMASGMIGVPEFTETGVKVKMLFDSQVVVGGLLRIESKINQAANGDYTVSKLSFDLSNRDTSFYYEAEAVRA